MKSAVTPTAQVVNPSLEQILLAFGRLVGYFGIPLEYQQWSDRAKPVGFRGTSRPK
jgi:hypothetical protein